MSLLRLLLWIVIAYIVWKIIKLARSIGGKKSDIQSPIPPFSDVQDADFEDLTPPKQEEDGKGEETKK